MSLVFFSFSESARLGGAGVCYEETVEFISFGTNTCLAGLMLTGYSLNCYLTPLGSKRVPAWSAIDKTLRRSKHFVTESYDATALRQNVLDIVEQLRAPATVWRKFVNSVRLRLKKTATKLWMERDSNTRRVVKRTSHPLDGHGVVLLLVIFQIIQARIGVDLQVSGEFYVTLNDISLSYIDIECRISPFWR